MKRMLAWLIVLSMLLSFSASMEELRLPVGLTNIEEEAFMGDDSVSSVNLPHNVRSIGARAFRNCRALKEIYIPDTVTYIGEQAFDEDITISCGPKSYAYQYAQQNGYKVNALGNVVYSVWMDGNDIHAVVSTISACTLLAEMLDDEMSQQLYSASLPLDQDVERLDVKLTAEEVPESFVLRASLLDENGKVIGDPCVSMDYTSKYKEFERKTPDDFPKEQVLNYGAVGFGVLDESVIIVTGSRQGSGYRITSDKALHAGDAIYIRNLNELVKISAVSQNADGSYTVTPAKNADLAECYQYLRYSDTFDAVESLSSRGMIPRSAVLTPRGSLGGKQFSKTFKSGPLTLNCNMEVSVHCDLKVDRALFPDRYIDVKTYGMVSGGITYTLSDNVEFSDAIPVFEGYIPTSVPGVFVNLDVSIPINFGAEGELTFDTSFQMKGGVAYNTNSGVSPIKEGSLSQTLTTKAKVTGSAGVRLGVDLMYMNVLSVGAGATVGASVEAKTAKKTELGENPEDVEKKHACVLCFDVDIDSFIDLDANIALQMLGERDTLSKTWPAVRKPIFKGYLSVLNDKDSVHGGKVVFDRGECPNYKYRTKYQAFNQDGKERAKFVTVNRVDPKTADMVQVDAGISKYYAYLYPGAYEAETYFEGYFIGDDFVDGQTVKERFSIVDAARDVELRLSPDTTPTPTPTATPTPTPTAKPTDTPDPGASTAPGIQPVENAGKIPVTADYFPDAALRAEAESWDVAEYRYADGRAWWEKDGYLTAKERNNCTGMYLYGCSSLQGLEYFTKIEQLSIYDSSITKLTLGGFAKLEHLLVSNAPITEVNVKGCSALRHFQIEKTQIKSLDVSGMDLMDLYCYDNPKLLSLNLKGCKDLEILHYSDPLETINISGCTSLESFNAYGPDGNETTLKSLDCSGCASMDRLYIVGNPMLSRIDLDGCASLEFLEIQNSALESLTARQLDKLTQVLCSDNDNLKSLDLSDCPALCGISASNSQLERLNLENCRALNSMQISTCTNLASLNLKGCTSLESCYMPCGKLTELNVQQCTALESIRCGGNQLATLDVSSCTALKELDCQLNQLLELDVRDCIALESLYCSSNYIKTLDVSNMKQLERLTCDDNQITELNISGCEKLSRLDCWENAFSQLDARECPLLLDNCFCDPVVEVIR